MAYDHNLSAAVLSATAIRFFPQQQQQQQQLEISNYPAAFPWTTAGYVSQGYAAGQCGTQRQAHHLVQPRGIESIQAYSLRHCTGVDGCLGGAGSAVMTFGFQPTIILPDAFAGRGPGVGPVGGGGGCVETLAALQSAAPGGGSLVEPPVIQAAIIQRYVGLPNHTTFVQSENLPTTFYHQDNNATGSGLSGAVDLRPTERYQHGRAEVNSDCRLRKNAVAQHPAAPATGGVLATGKTTTAGGHTATGGNDPVTGQLDPVSRAVYENYINQLSGASGRTASRRSSRFGANRRHSLQRL